MRAHRSLHMAAAICGQTSAKSGLSSHTHTFICNLPPPSHPPPAPCQVDLWKTSGHFDFYRDSMFNQMDVDAEEYQVGAALRAVAWMCLLASCCYVVGAGHPPPCPHSLRLRIAGREISQPAQPEIRQLASMEASVTCCRRCCGCPASHHPRLWLPSILPPLQLKPMNCPFHISVYKQGYYSYRDLPIRWAELGTGERAVGVSGLPAGGCEWGVGVCGGDRAANHGPACCPALLSPPLSNPAVASSFSNDSLICFPPFPLLYCCSVPLRAQRHHARPVPRARLHPGKPEGRGE